MSFLCSTHAGEEEAHEENGCAVATRTAFVPPECPSRIGDNSVQVRYCPQRRCAAAAAAADDDDDDAPEEAESDAPQCAVDEDTTPMCCSPTEFEKIQVPCYGFVLSMITPAACECKPCDDPTAGQITLNGRAVDKTERTPLKFGKVWLGGEEVAETDIVGAFTISLPRGIERLVLTFTDPRFSKFHQSTKVLHLSTEKSVIFYTFHIPLLQKNAAAVDGNIVTISHRKEEIVKIELPEDADVFGTVVSQSIYASSYKDNIGDSFTIEAARLEQPISIVMLLCLTVLDETQSAVDLPGKYTFSFSKAYVNEFMESHQIEEIMLFELDATSGYWNSVADVDMPGEDAENGAVCPFLAFRIQRFRPSKIFLTRVSFT